jgi:hypothetical protein
MIDEVCGIRTARYPERVIHANQGRFSAGTISRSLVTLKMTRIRKMLMIGRLVYPWILLFPHLSTLRTVTFEKRIGWLILALAGIKKTYKFFLDCALLVRKPSGKSGTARMALTMQTNHEISALWKSRLEIAR